MYREEENFRTIDGKIMHRNVHDGSFHEKRGDTIITRAMTVSSSYLGIIGECDAVEFRKDKDGISIFGFDGKYSVVPVEYKRGKPEEIRHPFIAETVFRNIICFF